MTINCMRFRMCRIRPPGRTEIDTADQQVWVRERQREKGGGLRERRNIEDKD